MLEDIFHANTLLSGSCYYISFNKYWYDDKAVKIIDFYRFFDVQEEGKNDGDGGNEREFFTKI